MAKLSIVPRKTSVNVLKHLSKLATDLDAIAQRESEDQAATEVKIVELKTKLQEHQKETELALKVADNIRQLIGEK